MAVDRGVLRRLYVDEGLTAGEIAARLGCAATTVFRRLRRFGIPVRPPTSRPRPTLGEDSLRWTADLAYAVGLIATDGNLSRDGRHLAIPSKDYDLLATLRQCLQLRSHITVARNAHGVVYRLQWSDRTFYDWLLAIGLTPAKSLTLRPLLIPDEYFADFFRGCVDGDGSVLVYTDRYHTNKKPCYVYERLYVSLVSASRQFLEWAQGSVLRLAQVRGTINIRSKTGANPVWALRYAKAESIRVLRWMYDAPGVPALSRKRVIAEAFLVPRPRASRVGPGRPMVV
jgi:hypothetical protein